MKKQRLFLVLVAFGVIVLVSFTNDNLQKNATYSNPDQIPVCQASSMAALANNPDFQKLHQSPKPFIYQGRGEMVTFNTPDGATAKGFLIKAAKPSKKWLLVYQEWWGLNDNIKEEARQLADKLQDVNVLAPDMYDGKLTTDPAEAGKLLGSVKPERLSDIMKGTIGYVGTDAKIASIGWCFGGGLSVQSAMLAGKKAIACVLYYGFPERDAEKLKALQTDVYAIFGSKDTMISGDMVKQFEEGMQQAGKQVKIDMFEAGHAFANPSNLINTYNKPFADEANKRALAYLQKRLK